MKILPPLIALLLSSLSNAQEATDKQILKFMKAKDIEWMEGEDGLAKVKMKSTKQWGVYRIYSHTMFEEPEIEFEEIVAPKFDSIGWFEDLQPFTIVKSDYKYGILLNPYEIVDASDKAKCKYDEVRMKELNGRYYALVRKESNWGLVDWFEGVYLVDPSFKSADEVPLVWVESWAIDGFVKSKKAVGADILIYDEGNGDGVFKARNKHTKKWGMYQSFDGKNVTTLVPAEYDSLRFFPFNGNYTAVYNEGKVGFYLSYWSYDSNAKQTVPCIYEDYKRYNADGVPKLAVMKNGKWGWVDWLTGEEKSEFKYETTEELPYPYYNQELWFEE